MLGWQVSYEVHR